MLIKIGFLEYSMRWRWPEWLEGVSSKFNIYEYSREEIKELEIIRSVHEQYFYKQNSVSLFLFNETLNAPNVLIDRNFFHPKNIYADTFSWASRIKKLPELMMYIFRLAEGYININGEKHLNSPFILFLSEFKAWLDKISNLKIDRSVYEEINSRISYIKSIATNPLISPKFSLDIMAIAAALKCIGDNITYIMFQSPASEKFLSLQAQSERMLSQSELFLSLLFSSSKVFQKQKLPHCESLTDFEVLFSEECDLYNYIKKLFYKTREMTFFFNDLHLIANEGGNAVIYTLLGSEVSALLNVFNDILGELVKSFNLLDDYFFDQHRKYRQKELQLSDNSQWPKNYHEAMAMQDSLVNSLKWLKNDIASIQVSLSDKKYSNYVYWGHVKSMLETFKNSIQSSFNISGSTHHINYLPKTISDSVSCVSNTEDIFDHSSFFSHLQENSHPCNLTMEEIETMFKISSNANILKPNYFLTAGLLILMMPEEALALIPFIPVASFAIKLAAIPAIALISHMTQCDEWYLYSQPAECYSERMLDERKLFRFLYSRSKSQLSNNKMNFFDVSNLLSDPPKKQVCWVHKATVSTPKGSKWSDCFFHTDLSENGTEFPSSLPNIQKHIRGISDNAISLYQAIENKQVELIESEGLIYNDPYILFLQEMKLWVEELTRFNDPKIIFSNVRDRYDYIDGFQGQSWDHLPFDQKRKRIHLNLRNFTQDVIKESFLVPMITECELHQQSASLRQKIEYLRALVFKKKQALMGALLHYYNPHGAVTFIQPKGNQIANLESNDCSRIIIAKDFVTSISSMRREILDSKNQLKNYESVHVALHYYFPIISNYLDEQLQNLELLGEALSVQFFSDDYRKKFSVIASFFHELGAIFFQLTSSIKTEVEITIPKRELMAMDNNFACKHLHRISYSYCLPATDKSIQDNFNTFNNVYKKIMPDVSYDQITKSSPITRGIDDIINHVNNFNFAKILQKIKDPKVQAILQLFSDKGSNLVKSIDSIPFPCLPGAHAYEIDSSLLAIDPVYNFNNINNDLILPSISSSEYESSTTQNQDISAPNEIKLSYPSLASTVMLSTVFIHWGSLFYNAARSFFSEEAASSTEIKSILSAEEKKVAKDRLHNIGITLKVMQQYLKRHPGDKFSYIHSMMHDYMKIRKDMKQRFLSGENILDDLLNLEKDVQCLKEEFDADIKLNQCVSFRTCPNVHFWRSNTIFAINNQFDNKSGSLHQQALS